MSYSFEDSFFRIKRIHTCKGMYVVAHDFAVNNLVSTQLVFNDLPIQVIDPMRNVEDQRNVRVGAYGFSCLSQNWKQTLQHTYWNNFLVPWGPGLLQDIFN